MSSRWTQAATILAPTIKVCDKRLLPFCLRHRVALEAIDSPILNTDKEMTGAHLVAAVRILSTYDLETIRKAPSIRERVWGFRADISKTLLFGEMIKIHHYMTAQSLWPRFWVKEGKSNPGEIPWVLAIIANLVRNGCTLEEAWTMPESEAIWLHVANCSANGSDVSLITDEEWQAMEDFKKQESCKTAEPKPKSP
jgi:hypothetical protein